MRWQTFSWLLLALFGLSHAISSSGTRLLALLDEDDNKDKYSKFFSDLEARGYSTNITTPKSSPRLFHLGARSYDHLLILPTKLKSLGPTLTPQTLLDFQKEEGNILLALSSTTGVPSSLASTLLELDIAVPSDRDAVVVDHFSYDTLSSPEQHDVLLLPAPKPRREDVQSYFEVEGPLAVPHAVPHVLGNSNPLLTPILNALTTAYSYNAKDEAEALEEPFATGSQLSLVSTMQARNSARFTVLGAGEMLQDSWCDASVQGPGEKAKKTKSGNREFAKRLSAWTFKEVGVLKVGRLHHYLNEPVGASSAKLNDSSVSEIDLNPKIYRVKNQATFSIELSEYSQTHWTPFTPPSGDALQLEFTMLNPYHRLPLHPSPHQPNPNSTLFTTTFRLPDQHGIFNFRVNYKRPFLTYVDEKRTVTVRHFAHDEYKRSFAISGAYPWILGVVAVVTGWTWFVGVWLWSAPVVEEEKKRK